MAETELDALILRIRRTIDESKRLCEYARDVANDAREKAHKSLNGNNRQATTAGSEPETCIAAPSQHVG